ncbi:TPR repeat-containing protein [Oleidesulfovibrio alaskensis G20]|uniref:TPR repeat-containing protein n=1 Tax=Oleidesulfovibrio alaskensis (strain ATCC BAA-1058 / DSM 17464 / G20) TaxID=207559 RepID=Q30V58_OLEA2|nr:tetratricopeptide repeat protein [Oleidesulfovibrio alaskensis]ABB40438.1 TPR repeat-containing protein [Oleidesulfovibrio alaskensis G20]MBG0772698.1 tetratricopeptide repeat protein [Oleidesulfovibrio alaskensis]
MSAELTRARKQLTQVRSLLRQGKVMPAAQSYHTALLAVLKNPLMKAEKEEFERLLDDAAHHLNNDAELRRVFPLTIAYKPGAEREVLDVVASLVKALEEAAVSEAQEQLRQFEASKEAEMRRGQQMLDDRQFEDAQKHFRGLVARFEDDAELKGEIGDRFLKAGRYEEAFEYLAQALDESPESVHLYNRIGIALRKLGKFDVAEKYYFKAAKYTGHDPHLFFNLGRLYVDWGKWDRVAKAAGMALKLKPDFVEAEKMLNFALKKIQ